MYDSCFMDDALFDILNDMVTAKAPEPEDKGE